jgi:hypothetical protein
MAHPVYSFRSDLSTMLVQRPHDSWVGGGSSHHCLTPTWSPMATSRCSLHGMPLRLPRRRIVSPNARYHIAGLTSSLAPLGVARDISELAKTPLLYTQLHLLPPHCARQLTHPGPPHSSSITIFVLVQCDNRVRAHILERRVNVFHPHERAVLCTDEFTCMTQ